MKALPGIVLPICLLALGTLADRIFHHHAQAPVPVADDDDDDDDDLIGEDFEDWRPLYKEIRATCAIPDSIPVCAPARFATQFGTRLRAIDPTGRKFERRWLAALAAGDHFAAYGLGWLRSRRALPALRWHLLNERYFHAWETSQPDAPESLYADAHFPRHHILILAIEAIEGRPFQKLIQLRPGERGQPVGGSFQLWRRPRRDVALAPTRRRPAAQRRGEPGAAHPLRRAPIGAAKPAPAGTGRRRW